MNWEKIEEQLGQLPLYCYHLFAPAQLEFSARIRHICRTECPMYGQSWACPPAVGEVDECRSRCLDYSHCLMVATITEVRDISNISETLATRPEHEALTNQVGTIFRENGITPYILSTEACAECARCAYLDGRPCHHPERMHPCVESHGINVVPVMEEAGLSFNSGKMWSPGSHCCSSIDAFGCRHPRRFAPPYPTLRSCFSRHLQV